LGALTGFGTGTVAGDGFGALTGGLWHWNCGRG